MVVSPYTHDVAGSRQTELPSCSQEKNKNKEGFGKDTNAAAEHACAPLALLYTLWQVKIVSEITCRLQPLPEGGNGYKHLTDHILTTTFLVF